MKMMEEDGCLCAGIQCIDEFVQEAAIAGAALALQEDNGILADR